MSGLPLVFGICVFTLPAIVFPNRFGVRLAVLLLCLIAAAGGHAGGLVLGGPLWLLGLTVAICSWTSRRTAQALETKRQLAVEDRRHREMLELLAAQAAQTAGAADLVPEGAQPA
jgi:hypothetical protein